LEGRTDTEGVAAAGRWLEDSRRWFEEALARFLAGADLGPPALREALEYALLGGGKRVRPAIVRLVAGEAADPAAVEAAAVAVECIHTYSLVHDDLPCMDDDDLRRGRPTVHRAYSEATAVLVGDGLQALAFEALAGAPEGAAAMTRALARGAGPAGMVGGQALDLDGEGRDLGVEAVREIHRTKTAALLAASAELGALAGGSDPARVELAGRFGLALGMCFQATDDVLDVTGDATTLGKTPGKDAGAAKGTLVAALGLEGARDEARLRASEAHTCAKGLGLGGLGEGLIELLLRRNS
jgi:farnesyl diphosphate synthase